MLGDDYNIQKESVLVQIKSMPLKDVLCARLHFGLTAGRSRYGLMSREQDNRPPCAVSVFLQLDGTGTYW